MCLLLSGLVYWTEVSCGPYLGSERMHAEASCLASQILAGSAGLRGWGRDKLSTHYQMADLGGLRQGGKVRSSSEKWIIEGATAEWQPHWGIKPHPLETTVAGTASLHRDSLKATAPRGQRW